MTLTLAGSGDEAMALAAGLIDAAEATHNPLTLSYALSAYGFAFRDANPDRAREAMRRGVVIAHDSGNRFDETHLAGVLALLEAKFGDPLAALEYFTVAIRDHHEAGNAANLRPRPCAGWLDGSRLRSPTPVPANRFSTVAPSICLSVSTA